jgi:FkbM family methyltransferase
MTVRRFVRRAAGFRPDTIVHVGAHLAGELRRYEKLRPRRIVWIEADPVVAAEMRSRVAATSNPSIKHICIEAVVTDADGVDTALNVFNNAGASSSIFRSTETLRSKWPGLSETGEVKRARSSRLDTILQNQGVLPDNVDVLVLDIQGAELLCLKGAGAYLDHVVFIGVEASQEPIYEGGVLFPELDGYLNDGGFARISPVPWHGDVVYVRRSSLHRPGFRRLRGRAAAPDRPLRRGGVLGFLQSAFRRNQRA